MRSSVEESAKRHAPKTHSKSRMVALSKACRCGSLRAFVCNGFGACKMFAHCAARLSCQIPFPPERGWTKKLNWLSSVRIPPGSSRFYFSSSSFRRVYWINSYNQMHHVSCSSGSMASSGTCVELTCPGQIIDLLHGGEAQNNGENTDISDCNGDWNATLSRKIVLAPSPYPVGYRAAPMLFSGVFDHVLI